MAAMCEICKDSLPLTESRCADCQGVEMYTNEEIKALKDEAYREGGQEVLNYLQGLYDGVEDTDIWSEFFDEEEK